jgi:hypothetical protein
MLNRQEYSFYIDGLPPGPLLYCTQEQYSSLMNPPVDNLFPKSRTKHCHERYKWIEKFGAEKTKKRLICYMRK